MVGYISSGVLVVTVLMSFMGLDADADADIDTDSDSGSGIFTFKNLLSFLAGFGLIGSFLRDEGYSNVYILFGGIVSGLVLTIVLMTMLYYASFLDKEVIVDYSSVTGDIYKLHLGIPKNGTGKILVSINGSVKEFECKHYLDDKSLPSGHWVTIVEYVDGIYIVS